jgi:hypothetical protein
MESLVCGLKTGAREKRIANCGSTAPCAVFLVLASAADRLRQRVPPINANLALTISCHGSAAGKESALLGGLNSRFKTLHEASELDLTVK